MPTQVLVVEDESLVAADIQGHLETLGYDVPKVTSSGEEAVRRATENRPDLVLMDIQLKGRMDGIEAARILQFRFNIPVVYVTAFADDRTLQRAKSTEPYGYVLKPFGKRELQTAIELALHKHGRERRLRTSEQWLMALIANIAAAVAVVDHAGLICLMNPMAEEITGAPLNEALGVNWTAALSFADSRRSPPECPVWRAVHENAASELVEAPVLFPKTGRKALLCGAVSPLGGADGENRAAILVFRDITARQQMENHYRQSRHLEDMQRLAGGLAHQFSNFLTLISGCTESLARGLDAKDDVNDQRLREVKTIQKVTERAGNLTRDLIAFSRGQAPVFKVVDVNQAIAKFSEMLKSSLGSKVKLDLQLDADAAKVEVDPAHLEQILIALAENARDAMPEGGTATIRTCNFEVDDRSASKFVDLPAGTYVRIDVADTGVGMSYDTQAHIFEPFFTRKERARATGLGLAAAYGTVKQNRGHIWFESEPKKGATFSVCLPKASSALTRGINGSRLPHGSETILVVDDDVEARAGARDILLDLGYRVLEAALGGEALKICAQPHNAVKLVLSGVIMPHMTGHELARRLAEARPGVKLLLMSNYSEYALRSHGNIEAGARILQKPLVAEALAVTVRTALDEDPGSLDPS